MASEWPTSVSEYIGGHLGRFTVGESVPGPVTWALHLDTLLVSFVLGFIGFYWLAIIAKRARVKEPSKSQVACELLFSFFDRQVRDLFPNAPPIIAPVGITIFIWVVLMNSMDWLPVDLITSGSYLATGSVAHFKLLSTADLSVTAALALSVFAMTYYYNIKVKGIGGFLREVATAPFGAKLMPFNILLRCVEDIAKPLSLSMRLFGNLLAAEIIFLLIASLPFWAQWPLGVPWAIYHILVVPLQAYIFAVLTVAYLALAHETH